jgi:hypothetical protein
MLIALHARCALSNTYIRQKGWVKDKLGSEFRRELISEFQKLCSICKKVCNFLTFDNPARGVSKSK